MGCTNPKQQKKVKGQIEDGKKDAEKVHDKHAAPPQDEDPAGVPKISVQQAERRRNELRRNLDEGGYHPPKIALPKIQVIQQND